MSRPQLPVEEQQGRQLLSLLASNTVAFNNLLAYGRARLAKEEATLHELATNSLLHPDTRDAAVMQLGRVDMLKTLLTYADSFNRS